MKHLEDLKDAGIGCTLMIGGVIFIIWAVGLLLTLIFG